ncbi:ATP-binding protein [Alteromonas lipolytica]|uniref:histidine kinase n=1 Tax=Alteromonas lipolytica TaxID=1856405 RepID=A0A1E8FII5_9ALTE|nr:ATP-binding protein [Alteromonas lipolytica]OFI35752.1 hypothetical protein BFC17_10725 [Alteromonas lipolytica]GGF80481.1 two-component sensor histidine kinase [Alteromonas lipolytica]
MISPIRNFNLKVLGWFWLTLLVSVLSIAIPAVLIQQFSAVNHLHGRDREIINVMTNRIDEMIISNEGNLEHLSQRIADNDGPMPFQWFVIDSELNIVLSSAPIRKALRERLGKPRFWYFLQSDHLRDINLEWTRMLGPSAIPSRPDWKLVLWRPERPKPMEIFRTMPWWSILAIFVVVTSVMSYLLVRSIAQPLNRLGQAFNAVGNGQLTHKVDVSNRNSRDNRFAANAQFLRLFEQFNEMTARIAALIQHQKRQSADISHELRTPLTRLQMTLALVRNKSRDEAIQPLLERAEKESELLNLHIQRLSDLTTMEAHAIQQGKQRLTTQQLLSDLCEDAAFEARQMGIAWQHSLCPATLDVFEEPFVTAIENVVRNAFKYASATVNLRCECEGEWFKVIICDDGPGVASEELARLTKAFYRTDSARNSDTGGLGLGLAIAAEAMRLNEGGIHFALAKPHGLRVTLQFRLAVSAMP